VPRAGRSPSQPSFAHEVNIRSQCSQRSRQSMVELKQRIAGPVAQCGGSRSYPFRCKASTHCCECPQGCAAQCAYGSLPLPIGADAVTSSHEDAGRRLASGDLQLSGHRTAERSSARSGHAHCRPETHPGRDADGQCRAEEAPAGGAHYPATPFLGLTAEASYVSAGFVTA